MATNFAILPHKNYFSFAAHPPKNERHFMSFINEMIEYFGRSWQQQHQTIFPVEYQTIFYILFCLTRFPFQDDHGIGSLFKQYLGYYLQQYYLTKYHANDVPLLYFMILIHLADSLDKPAYDGKHKKLHDDDGARYHLLGLKYYKMYKDHSPNRYCNVLIDNVLEALHLTMLPKYLLIRLTIRSIDYAIQHIQGASLPSILHKRKIFENAAFLVKESFKSFVIDHKEFSIYHRDLEDYCCAGFKFVTDMTRKMIEHDTPRKSKMYQKRYKYLLKRAIKSLKEYGNCSMTQPFGLFHVHLGHYYAVLSQNKNHLKMARNYLIKGMKIIQSFNKYMQCLEQLYDFLIWVLRALGRVDECIVIIGMAMDFNAHYNVDSHNEYYAKQLLKLGAFKKVISTGIPELILEANKENKVIGPYCWKWMLQNRVQTQRRAKIIPNIYGPQLSSCIYYFKEDKYYRVLKNIVSMKECNYSQCRAKNIKLEICSKCKSVYYCCKKHQKLDWKIKHRFECKQYEKRNPHMTCKNMILRWREKKNPFFWPGKIGPHRLFVDVLS